MRIGRSRARGRLCPRLVGVRLVAAEQFVAGERGITCFSLPEKWRTVSQLLLTIFAVMLIGLTGVADHLVWRIQNVAADLERLNQIWEQAWLDKEAGLAENRWHMSMCTSGPTVRSSILIISVE